MTLALILTSVLCIVLFAMHRLVLRDYKAMQRVYGREHNKIELLQRELKEGATVTVKGVTVCIKSPRLSFSITDRSLSSALDQLLEVEKQREKQ